MFDVKTKLEEKNKKIPSLKSQSAWLLFAKVVGFAFSFLLPLLIVRFLNQEQVGVYRQAFLVIVNANATLTLGFGMSAYYFLARETAKRSAVVFNTLLFNFAVGGIACLTLFLYPQLIGNLFQSDEITRLAPKIGIVIWLWIFSYYLETIAVANREPKMATAFIILAQLTKAVLMISAVIVFSTVEAFIYAAMTQAAIQSVVLVIYLHSRFPKFWTAFDAAFFREQLFYALPFGFAGLMWTLQSDVHNYFVSHRFGSAEFAVYSTGCFELPLIAMLAESINSILISRMSELQARGNVREIVRLTARAAEKLAFAYFPLYIFFVITAQTFITTLFTRNYAASVPIFLINLTFLPFYILVTDPIVRAYKELGRLLLISRVFIVIGLIAALYFGIQNFGLRGMIGIVVVTFLVDKFVSIGIVLKKIKLEKSDLPLFKNVLKTAAASLIAGAVTYLFYAQLSERIFDFGEDLAETIYHLPKVSVADFIAGSLVLGCCGLIFAPVYLLSANFLGAIDENEKRQLQAFWKKVLLKVRPSKTEELLSKEQLTADS